MVHQFKRALWMLLLRLPALLTGFSLLLATPAYSQDPSTVIAVTPCENNVVATFVNLDFLGTDSVKEILVHEARHREQAHRAINKTGHCPDYSDHLLLLADEVDAYCVSSVERIKRHTARDVDSTTILRMLNQFDGDSIVTRDSIVVFWKRGCPKFANPPADRRELPGRNDGRLVTAQADYCASDISCSVWRMYVRLGDTPVGDLYIAHSGEYACIIDGWTAGKMKIGDRLACDWRLPSARNQ